MQGTKTHLFSAIIVFSLVGAALAACAAQPGTEQPNGEETTPSVEYGSGSAELTPEPFDPPLTPEVVQTLTAEQAVDLEDLGWISFTAAGTDRRDVWIIRPDGSDETNISLIFQNKFAEASSWGPDGSILTYDVITPGTEGARDIVLVDFSADELEEVVITANIEYDCYPSFSPDGSRIVYMSQRDGQRDLYIMDLEGQDILQLTDSEAYDYEPAWSPDGERIAFVSRRTGKSQIFIMDADGSNVVQLTDSDYLDWRPAWSPDGEWIAFESWREGNADIFIMRPDGSDQTQLTTSLAEDGHPHFSPDGRYLIFHSRRSGDYQLYLMELENPEEIWHLETGTSHALLPVWTGPGAEVPDLPQNVLDANSEN
jgi:Tol biopolymer transport system component